MESRFLATRVGAAAWPHEVWGCWLAGPVGSRVVARPCKVQGCQLAPRGPGLPVGPAESGVPAARPPVQGSTPSSILWRGLWVGGTGHRGLWGRWACYGSQPTAQVTTINKLRTTALEESIYFHLFQPEIISV